MEHLDQRHSKKLITYLRYQFLITSREYNMKFRAFLLAQQNFVIKLYFYETTMLSVYTKSNKVIFRHVFRNI